MGIFEEKQNMYLDFCQELNQYKRKIKNHISTAEALEAFDYYVNTDKVKWINIFDNGKLAGFLIIGKEEGEKHPDSDYSIAQAYVDPAHRRRGLMTREASRYLYDHPGKVSVLILEHNLRAMRFWPWLFAENGFKSMPITQAPGNEEVLCFGFEKESDS